MLCAEREHSRKRLGPVLIVLAAISWSTAGFFTRFIGLDAWTILLWRGAFGGLFVGVYLMALYGRGAASQFRALGLMGWIIVVCETLGMIAFVPALKLTTVANVAIIYSTVPLITAGLAWIWIRERTSARLIVLSAISLVGVLIMVSGSLQRGDLVGDALAFAMTMGMAVTTVVLRRHPDIPFPIIAFLANIFSACFIFPLASHSFVSSGDLWNLAAFGFVQMALGLVLFGIGARLAPAGEVALIGTIETPLAPLWVWLIFGEAPPTTSLVGGAIVMASVLAFLASEKHSFVAGSDFG